MDVYRSVQVHSDDIGRALDYVFDIYKTYVTTNTLMSKESIDHILLILDILMEEKMASLSEFVFRYINRPLR